eukprot:GILK01005433.1.p1 GENE.GILK01005433.1~~GILK01005433.1.p1  ORF type:complete len:300 (-),score=34.18 GILK01005433.1:182-1081(-)
MCRILIYKGRDPEEDAILLADLVTRPEHSIIKQSHSCRERTPFHDQPQYLNGDGFGIGWYTPDSPTPCVFTSISPAWNNANLVRLAEKVTSPLIYAHVRAASPGSHIIDVNCHPFIRGQLLWMHNGGVAHFDKLRRRVLMSLTESVFESIQGTTDSEHCFAIFQNLLTKDVEKSSFTPEELRDTMLKTLKVINEMSAEANITEPSLLNFAVSDGKTIIATRYVNNDKADAASLYYSSGTKFEVDSDGVYRMLHRHKREHVVIIASERLTSVLEDWVEVPRNHLVMVTPDANVLLIPIVL